MVTPVLYQNGLTTQTTPHGVTASQGLGFSDRHRHTTTAYMKFAFCDCKIGQCLTELGLFKK